VEPGAYDIQARQGTYLKKQITYSLPDDSGTQQGVDLTGFLARMKVRKFAKTDPPLLSLDSDTVGVDATGISWVDRTHGKFRIYVAATVTATIPEGEWVYDLELVPPHSPSGYDEPNAFALLAGVFDVAAEVTWTTP